MDDSPFWVSATPAGWESDEEEKKQKQNKNKKKKNEKTIQSLIKKKRSCADILYNDKENIIVLLNEVSFHFSLLQEIEHFQKQIEFNKKFQSDKDKDEKKDTLLELNFSKDATLILKQFLYEQKLDFSSIIFSGELIKEIMKMADFLILEDFTTWITKQLNTTTFTIEEELDLFYAGLLNFKFKHGKDLVKRLENQIESFKENDQVWENYLRLQHRYNRSQKTRWALVVHCLEIFFFNKTVENLDNLKKLSLVSPDLIEFLSERFQTENNNKLFR